MTRAEFFIELRKGLATLPQAEIEKVVGFYLEAIADRIEEGMEEQEAVASFEHPSVIAANILTDDATISKVIANRVRESHNKSSNRTMWIILAIIGIPVWLPLLISIFSVVLALYVSAIAVIFSLFAVVFSLFFAFLASLVIGGIYVVNGHIFAGVAIGGAAVFLLGLSMFLFSPVVWLAKKTFGLAVSAVKAIKRKIVKSGGE